MPKRPPADPGKRAKGPTPKRHKTPRSTALEFTRRVDEVYTLLLNGLGRPDILRFVAAGEGSDGKGCRWSASSRQIDNYIAAAKRQFIEYSKPDREEELGRALQRNDDLYTRCKKIQDYGRCLAVMQERAKLLGLYAPEKREHSGPGGAALTIPLILQMADEHLRARPSGPIPDRGSVARS